MSDRIVVAPEALADLSAAVGFLAERSPPAARRRADDFFSLIQRLAEHRFEGPETRLRTGELARSWPLPPFRVYYQRSGSVLQVLRFYHQSRKPIVR